jgi:hypothetical protein
LNVYLNIVGGGEEFAPSASGSADTAVASRLREAGIDSRLLGAIDGVVLLNATYRYGRREADALQRGYRDTLVSRGAIHAFTNGNEPGQFISTQNYLEATDTIIPPERLGFPTGTKRTWAGIVANPPGRLALERYAIQLAEADALTLGDGGNGYSFGPPVVREFMENYRRLPARPFTSRADAIDPVAVRSLVDGDKYYFYAVNRQPYPLSVSLRLSNASRCIRLADGSPQPARDNRIRLDLRPYELVAMEANATARIEAVNVVVSSDERALLERQIAAVDALASLSPLQVLMHGGPSETERKLLTDTVRAARAALARGWLWQAHAVLEHSSLLAIYKRTGCFPPAFSDGDREGRHCGD